MLSSLMTQGKVWKSYLSLGTQDEVARNSAMQTLQDQGSASLSCLNYALSGNNSFRTQCAAAVVLHRLGEGKGMAFLLDTLRWKLAQNPTNTPELEAAFLAIGNPDAAPALITIWNLNPDWRDDNPLVQSICRLWGQLRDPRVLAPLFLQASRIPQLFEATIPCFGETAVLYLERMLRDTDFNLRLLAIKTLRHIPTGSSFALLVPLLRDNSEQVRSVIPEALVECGVPSMVVREISEAIRAGYSSPEAIRVLCETASGQSGYLDLSTAEALILILERWNPNTISPSGDSAASILTTLPYLVQAPLTNPRVAGALCALLEKRPGATISAEIVRVLGMRGSHNDGWEIPIRHAFLSQLSSADTRVRQEAATALKNWGDPFGFQLTELLMQYRPQGNILAKFQSLLRGGSDASVVATQVVQQAGQWIAKVSKDAFERQKQDVARATILQDPRTYPLLVELLQNTLDNLLRSHNPTETEDYLGGCVAGIKALAAMPPERAKSTHNSLIRALRLVKHGTLYEDGVAAPFQKGEVRDIGNIVRIAASEALYQIYGNASFPLFLDALFFPVLEVRGTAIQALGRLGDVRALPYLQSIVNDTSHPHNAFAGEAIATIKRTNPHVMTLLRASSISQVDTDKLLRPVMGDAPETNPNELLRPSAEGEGKKG
jgi:HEAT repeat protein